MSQHSTKLHARYEELLREIHEYTEPDESFDPPSLHRRSPGVYGNVMYDHEELEIYFEAADTVIYMWTRWPQNDNPKSVTTYALHDGTGPHERGDGSCFGHMNSDEFSVSQLVFYTGLHYQLRMTERRHNALRHFSQWLRTTKTDRPDVFETFGNKHFENTAMSDVKQTAEELVETFKEEGHDGK